MADRPDESIWHLALRTEWEDACRQGEYRTSTLGLSLDRVGFIHCSTRRQIAGVVDRFYRDVTEPLVLLEIDPAALTAPLRREPAAGAAPGTDGELFPHIYGPLNTDAVVAGTAVRVRDGLLVAD